MFVWLLFDPSSTSFVIGHDSHTGAPSVHSCVNSGLPGLMMHHPTTQLLSKSQFCSLPYLKGSEATLSDEVQELGRS